MPRATSLLSWIIATTAIYVAAMHATEPGILPDELCHLGWARLLAGSGSLYAMANAGYCEPGYALLLTPLYWLLDTNESIYRGVIAINAVLAGACLPLARHIGAEHFSMSRSQAWAAGLLALLYPGILVYSRYATPEVLLYLLTLVWLLTWSRWATTRATGSLVLLTASVLALYLAHSRMIAFVLILALGATGGLILARDALQRRQALLTLAIAAAGLFVMHSIKQYAIPLAWSADPTVALDRIVFSLAPSTYLDVMAKVAGQLLFATLATLGLALIPLAWTVNRLLRAPWLGFSKDPAELKIMAAPIMLMVVAIEGSIFLNSADRFDLTFYGRYIGPLIVTSMIVGLSLLTENRHRGVPVVVVLIIATCVSLIAFNDITLPYLDYSRIHVVGALPIIDWLSRSSESSHLLARLSSISFSVALCILLLLRRRWHWYATFALASMLGMHALDTYQRGPSMLELVPAPVASLLTNEPCTIHWSTSINGRQQNHQKFRLQYLFPHCEITSLPGSDCSPPRTGISVVSADDQCLRLIADSLPFPPHLRVVRPAESMAAPTSR